MAAEARRRVNAETRQRNAIGRLLHEFFEAMYFAKTKKQDDRIMERFARRILRGR